MPAISALLGYSCFGPKTKEISESCPNERISLLKTIKRNETNEKILMVALTLFILLAATFTTLSALTFLGSLPVSISYLFPTAMIYLGLGGISTFAFSYIAYCLATWDKVVDSRRFLLGPKKIDGALEEWHLNAALLRECYEKAEDPDLKAEIASIANRYLGKAAPLPKHHALWERFLGGSELVAQTNCRAIDGYYHRLTSCEFPNNEVKKLNEQYALGKKSPIILTDSEDCNSLFPLDFHVIKISDFIQKNEILDVEELANSFCCYFKANFPEKSGNKELNKFKKGILLDATDYFRECIKTDNAYNKKRFDEKYHRLLESAQYAIKKAIKTLNQSTHVDREKLIDAFKKNCITISRVRIEKFGAILVLPLFSSLEGKGIKNFERLLTLVGKTGIYIGAVNFRKYILKDFQAFNKIKYIHQGKEVGNPFPNTDSLLELQLFKDMENIVQDSQKPKYVEILGGAAVNLLKGLLSEISKENWDKLMNDPQKRIILQTSLFKIQEQLSHARLYMNDYNRFTKSIELIHCELATLSALAKPFKEAHFAVILKNTLRNCVPKEVLPYLRGGLAKTSMSVFAGVMQAAHENNPDAIRVYTKGSYFEQISFPGNSLDFDEAINDPQIKIDVYSGMFNPNVSIEKTHTHYVERNLLEDVEKIFQKNNGQPFTVVVDCTIDIIHSEKSRKLLEKFHKEIAAGRINFVFLRSGKKFDELGNDDQYASAFYVVNNGADHWKAFNQLFTDGVYRPDLESVQWFCLAYKYASQNIDEYIKQIFKNNRNLLERAPAKLKLSQRSGRSVRLSTMESSAEPAFIDIKVIGSMHYARALLFLVRFYQMMYKAKIKAHTRASFGFYHPNFTIVRAEVPGCSTIRINAGLNENDNVTLLKFLKSLK